MFLDPVSVDPIINTFCYNGTMRKAGSPHWHDGLNYAIGKSIDKTTYHIVTGVWQPIPFFVFLYHSIELNTKIEWTSQH